MIVLRVVLIVALAFAFFSTRATSIAYADVIADGGEDLVGSSSVTAAPVQPPAPHAKETPVSPWVNVVNTILVALSGVVVWILKRGGDAGQDYVSAHVRSKALRDAADILISAGEAGALVAWSTYTKSIKEGREDGALTEEEAKKARDTAISAAWASVSEDGRALLADLFGSGVEGAMANAVARGHAKIQAGGVIPS